MKNFNLKNINVKDLSSYESKIISGGLAGWWSVAVTLASIVSGRTSGDLYGAM